LTKYFDTLEEAQKQLKRLFSERSGTILTRKLVQILDRGDTDEEWIDLLGTALKHISEADFEKQFEEISYALAQIDRLSPQALILLGRFGSWRGVRLSGTTMTSNKTVSGDWDMQVTNFLILSGVQASTAGTVRIAHAFRDLESSGMIFLNLACFSKRLCGPARSV
jgi:hypothetical protein